MRTVVALGGNALLRRGEPAEAAIQRARVLEAARLSRAGPPRRARHHARQRAAGRAPGARGRGLQRRDAVPARRARRRDEGMIGYLLEQELGNQLPRRDVVDAAHAGASSMPTIPPSRARPSRSARSTPSESAAARGRAGLGDRTRRRALPPCRRLAGAAGDLELHASPCSSTPERSSSAPAAAASPWLPTATVLHGVEAVIDKDLAAALLAQELDADALLSSPTSPLSCADWRTPAATPIGARDPGRAPRPRSRRARWARRSRPPAALSSAPPAKPSSLRFRISKQLPPVAREPTSPPACRRASVVPRERCGLCGWRAGMPELASRQMRSSAALTGDRRHARTDTARAARNRRQDTLLRAAQRGDPTARDRLVHTHMTTVRQVASRYQGMVSRSTTFCRKERSGSWSRSISTTHGGVPRSRPTRDSASDAPFVTRSPSKGRLIRLPKQIVDRAGRSTKRRRSCGAAARGPPDAGGARRSNRPSARRNRRRARGRGRTGLSYEPVLADGGSLATDRGSRGRRSGASAPGRRASDHAQRRFFNISPRGSARCWHSGSESAQSHGRTKLRPDFSTSRPDARRRSNGTLSTDFEERSKRRCGEAPDLAPTSGGWKRLGERSRRGGLGLTRAALNPP